MQMAAPAALFLVLMCAITLFGYRRFVRPGQLYDRIGARGPAGPRRLRKSAQPKHALLHALRRLGSFLPASPQDARATRGDLAAAGYRAENALQIYYGIRIALGGAMLLLALAARAHLPPNPMTRLVLTGFATFLGFSGPSFALGRLIRTRQDKLRLSLPDALDLMVVSVEAGVGLDQALLNVSRELQIAHKELCDELGLVNLEMRAGKRRAEALRNLAERTRSLELRRLVAVLIQSDRFGTSVGEALRTHSDYMRVRRRQEAEERAGKVGAKLVFPIFFFILPSMLVVAAGPGLLQVFKYLFPLMRSFQP